MIRCIPLRIALAGLAAPTGTARPARGSRRYHSNATFTAALRPGRV